MDNALVNYIHVKKNKLLLLKEYNAQPQTKIYKMESLTTGFYKKAGKIRRSDMFTKTKSQKWCVLKVIISRIVHKHYR